MNLDHTRSKKRSALCRTRRNWQKVNQRTRELEREYNNMVKLYMLLCKKEDSARATYHAANHATEQATQQCNQMLDMIRKTYRDDLVEMQNQFVILRARHARLRKKERYAYLKHENAYTAVEQVAEQLKKLFEQHINAQAQLSYPRV